MSYKRYKSKRNQAKRTVRDAKMSAYERCGRKMTENFHTDFLKKNYKR